MSSRIRQLAMAPDTWERHQLVSELAGEPDSLLDVGGLAGELAMFMPNTRVTSANVQEGSDVVFDGLRLPFMAGSFDAAASLDVLEHIPPGLRQGHIDELARVSRGRVVLCCPLGTREHNQAERELADWYERVSGSRHLFLDEHLERGLPTEAELREMAARSPLDFEFGFHGDYRVANELFRLSTMVRTRPRPQPVSAYLRARFGKKRPQTLTKESAPTTNRAFLISRAHRP